MKRILKLLSLHIFLAGQEGFEPPTPGFGVRCSTVRATGLHLTGTTPKSEKPTDSFGLFVQGMFSAKAAILGKLKLVRSRPLIFHSRVISSLTLAACKGNDHSHCLPLNLDGFVKSPYAALRCIPCPVECRFAALLRRIQPGKSLRRTHMYASFLRICAPCI